MTEQQRRERQHPIVPYIDRIRTRIDEEIMYAKFLSEVSDMKNVLNSLYMANDWLCEYLLGVEPNYRVQKYAKREIYGPQPPSFIISDRIQALQECVKELIELIEMCSQEQRMVLKIVLQHLMEAIFWYRREKCNLG